jgi:hypothetical protein
MTRRISLGNLHRDATRTRFHWSLIALVGMLPCAATSVRAQGSCPTPVGRIVATSGTGTLLVSTLSPFPLPSGVVTTIDGGAADPNQMKQALTIPAGGFSVTPFCIPALGFTSEITATGCESGTADGQGTGWAAGAPCPDPEVLKVGDTSAPACGTLGTGCNTSAGGAGGDFYGDIDTTRGGTFPGDAGPCTVSAAGVHVQLDIPVDLKVWNDFDGNCPDDDLTYSPGTDTLVSQFGFILSPTTDQAYADFVDKNGDACSFAGNGPDHTKHCSADSTRPCANNAQCSGAGTCVDGAVLGLPAAGPGCVVGQSITLVAAGLGFTGSASLYDLAYAIKIPNTITACGSPVGSDTCTLNTNACLD